MNWACDVPVIVRTGALRRRFLGQWHSGIRFFRSGSGESVLTFHASTFTAGMLTRRFEIAA